MSASHSKLSLYDLSVEGMMIRDALLENEGEITPEIEQRIDALMEAAPERIEAAAMVVRTLEASEAACAAEADRFARRAKSLADNAARLKERMAWVVDAAFNGKVRTDRFTVWTQAAPEHVAFDVAEGHTIDEVESADASLVRVKKDLDKIALKEKFKAGQALPAAISFTRSEGKRYVRIK